MKKVSNALVGAGAGVGAVGAREGVDGGIKPCVVGPYSNGVFGHTP